MRYWIAAEQCDSVPGTFYLASAIALDSLGAIDSLTIQNRATLLGGADDGIAWASVDSVFPAHVASSFTNALVVVGSRFVPGTTMVLTTPNVTLQATSIQVVNDSTLTALVAIPPHMSGPLDVILRSPNGSHDRLEHAVVVGDVQVIMEPLGGAGPIREWPNAALTPTSVEGFCPEPYFSCSLADTLGTSVIRGVGCAVPASVTNTRRITYYFWDGSSVIGKNCPVGFKVKVAQLSGGHCHTDNNRPGDTFTVVNTLNTGSDGLQFKIAHTWSEVAGQLEVYMWSTDPACPDYNDSTTVRFVLCVKGRQLFRNNQFILLPGRGFTFKEGTATHPDNMWGIPEMNAAWATAAAEFADSVAGRPHPDTLVVTEMNLEWGGVFDLNLNWQSPSHCGHRAGMEMDVRSWNLRGKPKLLFESIARHHGFIVGYEGKKGAREQHYHLYYNGPGTFRGPGSTLP